MSDNLFRKFYQEFYLETLEEGEKKSTAICRYKSTMRDIVFGEGSSLTYIHRNGSTDTRVEDLIYLQMQGKFKTNE